MVTAFAHGAMGRRFDPSWWSNKLTNVPLRLYAQVDLFWETAVNFDYVIMSHGVLE